MSSTPVVAAEHTGRAAAPATTVPKSPTLSASQLATLAEHGEERTADVGDVLYRVGDRCYGVAVRDRSEIAALHGHDGRLESVTLTSGERRRFSFLFLFLGRGHAPNGSAT